MTARDLLLKYLDYKSYWSDERVVRDKPATVRRQQIDLLLELFNIQKAKANPLLQIIYSISDSDKSISRKQYLAKLSNLEYFERGEFLQDRPYEQYKELTDEVNKVIDNLFPGLNEQFTSKPVDLRWLFSDLLSFRLDVYKLAYPTSGMLEGFSSGLHYSHFLQNRLKAVIKDNLEEIDETLCLLIDPEKRTLDISKHAYPDVDLDAIDLAWRMENY